MDDWEPVLEQLQTFHARVADVADARDLRTATERGAELNRIVSHLDRGADQLSDGQLVMLDLAHAHVREMMDCPRRMRLDDTWPDDFVAAARKAADALVTLAEMERL